MNMFLVYKCSTQLHSVWYMNTKSWQLQYQYSVANESC